jgi:DNA-binding Lrp family transcriptional regulator
MSQSVEIDEVDIKILRLLIKDARTELKEIAEECGLSSNAIFKRIERLRNTGVITGTILFINPYSFGFENLATIGINVEPNQEADVANLIRKHAYLVQLDTSYGKYDICAFIMAKNIADLERLKQLIRKHPGVKRIAFNLWDKPHLLPENIGLQPQKS